MRTSSLPRQQEPSRNYGSARGRLNVLRKNIRKEQDADRCIVVELVILSLWLEVRVRPFSIVDKPEADPTNTGRTIHDLSYPEGASVNAATDGSSIVRPEYRHCDQS